MVGIVSAGRVDQLLASAHANDATGEAALALAGRLRAAGVETGAYALHVDDDMGSRVDTMGKLPPAGPDDTTVIHFNVPSALGDILAARPGRRVMIYHNLTPPDLLLPHCPEIARLTALGRRQLHELANRGCVDLAIGVSRFNTDDLIASGFAHTATLPLPCDLSRLASTGNAVLEAELARTPLATFIAVGRVAPNKRIEDFMKTAAYYLRYISPRARFLIVGGTKGLEGYADALGELRADLKLDGRVSFTQKVSLAELITYYRSATAYVCTSEHEGFCAPLLEAMSFDVPIVARKAAAIPETLGDAGVLIDSRDPAVWAETLAEVAENAAMRERMIARGRRRLADFDTGMVLDRWVEALAPKRRHRTQPHPPADRA